jgi:hypothetical protein
MNNNVDFQMVCGDCGSLAVKIENPEHASREAIIYCGDCGASRGTMGALRDLAVRPDVLALLPPKQRIPKEKFQSKLVEQYREVQSLRQKVQMAESCGK